MFGSKEDLVRPIPPPQNFGAPPRARKAGGKGKDRTPYYFFLMEKKAEFERQGKMGNRSQDSLSKEVFPIWKENKGNQTWMKPYIEQYQEWRKQRNGGDGFKFDTMGRSLADLEMQSKKQRMRKDQMEAIIESQISSLGVTGVLKAPFFIVHCNYLCKTDKEFFPPCEMAVAEFSLERGVTRVWQEFVSPGDSVPLGHKYKCQKHARVTHNLLPEFEHYETNHRQIVASLFQFLGSSEEGEPLPPLYVAPHHEVAASCIVEFLLAKSAASEEIRLFSLPKLMLEIYNLPLDPADVEGRMTVHVATSVLETDKYSHYAGIGCQFHEALDNPMHCSEAIVRRHVFDIADVCCRLYQLVLRPGRHLPPDQSLTKPDMEMKLKWTQTCHVKADTINRFVPTPGGVTIGADKFNPALDMVHRDDQDPNFPRLDHDIQGKLVKGSMFKGGVGRTLANKSYAGIVGEAFPGRDVRSQP